MSDFEMSPSEQDMAYEQMQEYARKERIEKYGFDVLDQIQQGRKFKRSALDGTQSMYYFK